MNLQITAYSAITAAGVYRNGELLIPNAQQEAFEVFIKEAYRAVNPGYAKFFKMDKLCKLAFLTAEVLLGEQGLRSEREGADVALVIGNNSSSIASDLDHYASYADRENYFPSPAVFVYTLPNIMLGELCIRHQITGENSCFLMQEPDAQFLYRYVQDLFENEGYTRCIIGWVDYTALNYTACLFLVEKAAAGTENISKFSPTFMGLVPEYHGKPNQ